MPRCQSVSGQCHPTHCFAHKLHKNAFLGPAKKVCSDPQNPSWIWRLLLGKGRGWDKNRGERRDKKEDEGEKGRGVEGGAFFRFRFGRIPRSLVLNVRSFGNIKRLPFLTPSPSTHSTCSLSSCLVTAMLWKRKKLPRKRKCVFNKSANVKSIKPQLVIPKAQHRQCQSYTEWKLVANTNQKL